MTSKSKFALIFAVVLLLPVTSWTQTDIFSKFTFSSHMNFQAALDTSVMKTIVGDDTTRAFVPYSAMVVLTLLQTWDAYLIGCRDSVQKRGRDYWTADTTSYRVGPDGKKLYFFVKSIPNYYRDRRENRPTIYGYIEWLRQRTAVKETP